ncbi:unnamed protein product [Pleuronectes platessa]|uniref:Uncharacterized protein n=1 Tax=Pleuronectes platessa TaxID=8262 RepID=A0A9N7UDH3_PLEPL|nr:unnamed protein product [Pleuronectes platessa]
MLVSSRYRGFLPEESVACLWPMLTDKSITCLCSDCLGGSSLPEQQGEQLFLLQEEQEPETSAVVSQGVTDSRGDVESDHNPPEEQRTEDVNRNRGFLLLGGAEM